MKRIPLTRGLFALVDDEDFANLSDFNWCAASYGKGQLIYAARGFRVGGGRGVGIGKTKVVSMHRQLMGEPVGMVVDHIDHNTLNNQKKNLRVCTRGQNNQNLKGAKKTSKTGVRGVSWCERDSRFHADLRCGETRVRGSFRTLVEASQFYKDANKKIFGEFGGGL